MYYIFCQCNIFDILHCNVLSFLKNLLEFLWYSYSYIHIQKKKRREWHKTSAFSQIINPILLLKVGSEEEEKRREWHKTFPPSQIINPISFWVGSKETFTYMKTNKIVSCF